MGRGPMGAGFWSRMDHSISFEHDAALTRARPPRALSSMLLVGGLLVLSTIVGLGLAGWIVLGTEAPSVAGEAVMSIDRRLPDR